jgi:DNA polymerase-3 subunit epsilon
MREVVLDIESTGLNIGTDRIIEIACIELFDKQPTGREIQSYINPKQFISEEATRIHGITNEMLVNMPVFALCWKGFADFIGSSPIVAHNASFDIGMINHELQIIQRKSLNNQVIDTLELARKKSSTNNSLDALAKRYKIKAERRLHGALKDCYILASVYYFLAINEIDMDSIINTYQSEEISFTFPYRKNPSLVSNEELQLHQSLLEKHSLISF